MSQLGSFVVAVISPNPDVHQGIAFALEKTSEAGSLWTLSHYPEPAEMTPIGQAPAGCIVFLDFSDPIRAKRVAAELDNKYPMAATIAVHSASRPQDLIELMHLGIREVITLPLLSSDAVDALQRAGRKLKGESTLPERGGRIFAFLPAKPGAGATTIATHVAAAAARLTQQLTLLIDFDLQLGMTSFLLKLHGEHSVVDALRLSRQLEGLWDRLVCRRGMLEILASAPVDFERAVPEGGAAGVLDFAKQHYQTICVDLPGEMREHELETLKRANEIFLVCTPDIGALHMAKRKTDLLAQLGIQTKVSIVVNRAQGRATLPVGDIESILQLPVRFTVAAAEQEIAEATQRAAPIEGRSTIAAQLETIARRMLPGDNNQASQAKALSLAKPARRFIEMFSITPVRDAVRR